MAEDERSDPEDRHPEDFGPDELDDVVDREELRERYYGLLQELRVLLPGVQILVAFLLTVPFSSRWESLGAWERDWYVVALAGGMTSVVVFATPTALHRVGRRQARSLRLAWSIQLVRVGMALLGVAMIASLVLVTGVLFSHPFGVGAGAIGTLVLLAAWVVLPRLVRPRDEP